MQSFLFFYFSIFLFFYFSIFLFFYFSIFLFENLLIPAPEGTGIT